MPVPQGTVLSDRSIRDAIATGLLVVDPFIPEHVQPSSLDMILGGSEQLVLEKGVFKLAATQRIVMPPMIQGLVHGRSSIGRLGIQVHFTAGLLDPGFAGTITLECMSFVQDYTFYPGDRLCQVSFLWLDRPAEKPYQGRYQGQILPTASRFTHDSRPDRLL